MKNLLVNDALQLYGDVGVAWDGGGFTAADVAASLAEHGEGDVTVRINSGGGIATEGMAIYSLLKSHPGKVIVIVDGVAASAASLIAMAGDKRQMSDGAVLMVHDPSTITVGTVEVHQKNAATLDKLADNYAGIYGRAAGMKAADARAIMKAETWYTAREAVKAGLATEVIAEKSAAKAAFDYRIYMRAPADLPRRPITPNSPTMIVKGSEKMNTENDVQDKPWAARFMRSAETSGLPLAQLNAIVEASASIDAARDTLIARVAERSANLPGPSGNPVTGAGETFDNPEFLGKAVGEAIYCRMTGKVPDGPAREFASRTLLDMGVAVAGVHGRRISWTAGRNAVADAVMFGGGHTTSDFPNLLGASGNRVLLEAYQASQSPLKQLARRRVADDFRPLSSLRLGEAPALLPVEESGEITYGTRAENNEKNQVKTFARLFSLSRQALINDDLNAFSDSARTWGMAAALCEADALAAIFLANSEAGSNLSDGSPIYHTNRGNKLASGGASALSASSVGSGQALLRNMKGLDGKTPLNLVPKFIVTGTALEQTAQQICATIAATKIADVNPFGGVLSNLVEPRFTSATSWRLFADPSQLPAFEIAYLNGIEGPATSQREGWNIDGMEFKCRFDFGAAPIEWRPTVYSPGA